MGGRSAWRPASYEVFNRASEMDSWEQTRQRKMDMRFGTLLHHHCFSDLL